LRTLAALVANDLAEVAERLCPASAALRRELRTRGALVAAVSGSGSAVFGVFETRERAQAALSDLPGAAWSAVSTVLDPDTMNVS
jgi:4-diphosphocytidyl-2C-methyl-D-erythritol kinase